MWKVILAAFIVSGVVFYRPTIHWTILDAHRFANETAVTVGSWCSGTVIDAKQGLIVTASHCVDKLKRANVDTRAGYSFTTYDAVTVGLTKLDDTGVEISTSTYTAEVVGDDPDMDVAILRVSTPHDFSKGAKINDHLPTFGERIFTVGHPVMLPTVVADGYISQPRIGIHAHNDARLVFAILFTAQMDHGSSGGALYNDAGELIGITNWMTAGGEHCASPAVNITALLKRIGLKLED